MITPYQSSTTTDSKYSHLSSDSSCSNCVTTKKQKDKRRRESQSDQIKTVTDYESGEIICSNCGMVISDKIQSTGPEWRNFEQSGTIIGSSCAESNTSRQRTGSPISLARYDKGLYTVVGEKDNDVYGRRLDPLVRHSMHKIRMYDMRTQLDTHNERNRQRAFTELDRLRSKLGLSDIVIEKLHTYTERQKKEG
jgi:transcription initiation factor TFIIB